MIWLQEGEKPAHSIPLPDYGDFRPEILKIPLLAVLEQEKLPATLECERMRGGPFPQPRPCLTLTHTGRRRRWPVCIITPARSDHTLCLQVFIHWGRRRREEHPPYVARLLAAVELAVSRLSS